MLLSKGATVSSLAASLISARTFSSSNLAGINLIHFPQSCSSFESLISRGTTRSSRAGPLWVLSHMILPRSDFSRLPDRSCCFIMAQSWRKKLTQHDSSCGFITMPSSASLRGFANGIRACLGTRFRMVGFTLATAIRVSTVRGSGTRESTTWQGLQKPFLFRLLFRIRGGYYF